MKYIQKVLCVSVLLLLSCQADDEVQEEIDKQVVVIDNVSEHYEAEFEKRIFLVEDENEIRGTYDYYPIMDKWALNFYATNTEGESIDIFIADYNGPGTYHSGENGVENFMNYSWQPHPDGNQYGWWSGESGLEEESKFDDSGTVVITAETETFIEGTFHFKGYNSPGNFRSIQEGKFKIAVTRDQDPVTDNTDNVSEYFEAEFEKRAFLVEDENEIQGTYDHYSTTDRWALNLFAKSTDGEVIEIYILDYKGPGTYYSGENGNENYMSYSFSEQPNPRGSLATWWSGETSSDESNGLDDAGVVVITAETETFVEGTFDFKGYRNPDSFRSLQNGTFKVAVTRD